MQILTCAVRAVCCRCVLFVALGIGQAQVRSRPLWLLQLFLAQRIGTALDCMAQH